MKRIILLLSLIISTQAIAQDCLKSVGGGACIVEEDGKYGVKKKDKYIIPAYFDELIDHSGKYFSVSQHNKWGMFDIKGHLVLTVAYDKIKVIDAVAGLIYAEGKDYHNLVITENIVRPKNANKISPFLCASNYETSVGEYLAFMFDLRKNPPSDFSFDLSIPDTSKMAKSTRAIFAKFLVKNEPCNERFEPFNNKPSTETLIPCAILKDKKLSKFLSMPITGVSFKQVQRYCLWLSDKMNAEFTNDLPYEMIFRMPKPLEWEPLAVSGLNEEMKMNNCIDSLNEKKCLLLNYKYNQSECSQTEEQVLLYGDNVVPTNGYNADENGLFNLFGNVAEMTTEQGVCKGGSYKHFAKHCNATNQIHYLNPEPWLGFRWYIEYRMKH
jgi:formylglycine-generating enzyme required for sulfatase activity